MTTGPEFDLIDRHFRGRGAGRGDVLLGVGDDAALVRADGAALATAACTVEARVERPDEGAALGRRAVACAAHRLALLGARPSWATLSLTLPRPEEAWLRGFSDGLAAMAGRLGIALVGGDTTRGEASATLMVCGPRHPAAPVRAASGDLLALTRGAAPGELPPVAETLAAAPFAVALGDGGASPRAALGALAAPGGARIDGTRLSAVLGEPRAQQGHADGPEGAAPWIACARIRAADRAALERCTGRGAWTWVGRVLPGAIPGSEPGR